MFMPNLLQHTRALLCVFQVFKKRVATRPQASDVCWRTAPSWPEPLGALGICFVHDAWSEGGCATQAEAQQYDSLADTLHSTLYFFLQAQRLLAAGQIDQEVDIDDGGATKKHMVHHSRA